MKKSIKTFVAVAMMAIVSLAYLPAQAQSSGTVQVSFLVTDILVLIVNPTPVALNLAALTDFQNGTSYPALAQLTASSNQAYDLKVRSDGNLTSGAVSIPISNVAVQASPTLTNTYTSAINLSTSDQTLVSNASAGLAKIYDVKYSVSANNPAFYVKGGLYTATLTYSISAH